MFKNIVIAFGSESGNAEKLAQQLATHPLLVNASQQCQTLDEVDLGTLTAEDLLIIITSTFGDGEPPGNAEAFNQALTDCANIPACKYTVFGIGDVAYTNFCQFGKFLDKNLEEKGAQRLINRVDADVDYAAFFTEWKNCLTDILAGQLSNGLDLNLQVAAYSEDSPHPAIVLESKRLNSSPAGIYHVRLDISGSNMHYRSGDLLYVTPKDDPALMQGLQDWYGVDTDITPLKGKELRILNKSVLRNLANLSGNTELKEKLKIKHKKALAEYLFGRDLLDVLQDCSDSVFINPTELAELLSPRNARAYSIASANSQEGGSADEVHLCIRDIDYNLTGRQHSGAASHTLCQASVGETVNVFTRANKAFHLKAEDSAPLIMIGAGTGIAPFMGFLRAVETLNPARETMLIFGERNRTKDFIYAEQLSAWQETGTLNHLITAFSRDQAEKIYVQDALALEGEKINRLIAEGAHLYICGSKANLDAAIDQALLDVLQTEQSIDLAAAEEQLANLYLSGRLHKDLY